MLPGVLTGQDLADFEATWEPAVVRAWQGVEVAKTVLWGQGPTLLQVLGTAYWRITVTNAGPVGAADVTVNDHNAPSCSHAAGSFALAAGAGRQVYCNSFLLALPLKNTATASFVAANSPHGTYPTTTAPSSAVACSLLCFLLPPDQH